MSILVCDLAVCAGCYLQALLLTALALVAHEQICEFPKVEGVETKQTQRKETSAPEATPSAKIADKHRAVHISGETREEVLLFFEREDQDKHVEAERV